MIDGLKLEVLISCIDKNCLLVIDFFYFSTSKQFTLSVFLKRCFEVPCPTFASHSEDIVAETRVERKRRGVSSGIK